MRATAASTSAASAPTSARDPIPVPAGSPVMPPLAMGSPCIGSLDRGSVAMVEPLRESAPNLHDRYSVANRSMAGAPQFSTDHFSRKLGLFYAAYFFFGGIQLPFFPLWLE